jgi:hypothetical protein
LGSGGRRTLNLRPAQAGKGIQTLSQKQNIKQNEGLGEYLEWGRGKRRIREKRERKPHTS